MQLGALFRVLCAYDLLVGDHDYNGNQGGQQLHDYNGNQGGQ